MPIEDWISDPIASERHERVVQADPERAVELALEMPAEGDRIVATLVRLRGMRRPGGGSGGTLEDFFRANGFIELERSPREIIVGIGVPAKLISSERIDDPAGWRGWNRPGWIKAAATFQAEPAGEGASRLTTVTQVEATDQTARRRFRLYWLVVGPFSALIRRRWLRQIAKAAEREA
jgi:hypothetical protein